VQPSIPTVQSEAKSQSSFGMLGKQVSSVQNKMMAGLQKSIVGTEADIQMIQMLGLINKSVKQQQT